MAPKSRPAPQPSQRAQGAVIAALPQASPSLAFPGMIRETALLLRRCQRCRPVTTGFAGECESGLAGPIARIHAPRVLDGLHILSGTTLSFARV